jgi:hypothetical protein
MTYMVGPEAQAAFFKASDEELSAKEAYKYVLTFSDKMVLGGREILMIVQVHGSCLRPRCGVRLSH